MAVRSEALRLLELLREGYSLEDASALMGISPVRARILVSYLASRGMIREVPLGCRGSCGSCPLRGSCSLASARIYLVRG